MSLHTSVLKEEAIQALALTEASVVVDATLGASGHGLDIVSKLGERGVFIGIDADREAIIEAGKVFMEKQCTVHLLVGNHRDLDTLLQAHRIERVDAILADLGWRMDQMSGNGKGFSFQVDEELIMTYGNPADYPFTAKDILNEWKEEDIKNVLKGYGEERFAGRIAHAIVERRAEKFFHNTFDLVEVVKAAVPMKYRHGRLHPATRTFQALRIAVNDELETLRTLIEKSVKLLGDKGRLAIITFHSLEDRIVKNEFRDLARAERGIVITKKPITATRTEVAHNPRARSAKLRIFEKHESIQA